MNTSGTPLALLIMALLASAAPAATRYVDVNNPTPTSPYTNWATAATVIQDAVDAADPGDTVLVTNGVYALGGKAIVGTLTNRVTLDMAVTLQSVKGPTETFIVGAKAAMGPGFGPQAIRCAYLSGGACVFGFTLTGGATQDAATPDPNEFGGGIYCESLSVVISNCIITGNAARYSGGGVYGGTLVNCVVSNNFAGIQGGGVSLSECFGSLVSSNLCPRNLGGGAYESTLVECELTRNEAGLGAGCFNSNLTNCVVIDNNAWFRGGGVRTGYVVSSLILSNSAPWEGGGIWEATAINSLIAFNVTDGIGGGAYSGHIFNSTVVSNSAGSIAGGVAGTSTAQIRNSICYFNSAPTGSNYFSGAIEYSCTLPLPPGLGNISEVPQFLNQLGGDFGLSSNSPCINAGNNGYVTTTNDLDGNPRIVSGTVDMGAYEFQGTGSVISYAWLQHYGLPTDGSADTLDADLDGHNAWQEWKAWTDPTNALSVLKLLPPQPDTNGTLVIWQSVSNHTYSLEHTTDPATTFSPVQTGIPSQGQTTSFLDTTATNGSFFYRVAVPE